MTTVILNGADAPDAPDAVDGATARQCAAVEQVLRSPVMPGPPCGPISQA
jgi:hypothetical protein